MNATLIRIGSREIGPGRPCYIVAEMSANHQRDYGRAVELVYAAHAAGADAIKLQTYTPDTITLDSDADMFRVGSGTPWSGRKLHELYAEACMPWEWQPKLMEVAAGLGLACFSSPFDHTAIDFLETLDVPAYKIASFELVDLALVRHAASTGKPLILSTGMATLGEIDEAVRTARAAGATEIALLKCTSGYPAPPQDMNLRTIPYLAEVFDVVAGLSDHTLGIAVPVAAATLGASLIEKHLTLSRADGGPDSSFSLEPDEFRELVDAVRTTEQALGSVRFEPTEAEAAGRLLRRSLFVVVDMAAGERFSERNVRSIRPATGLPCRHLADVLGRPALHPIKRGTPLSWNHVGHIART